MLEEEDFVDEHNYNTNCKDDFDGAEFCQDTTNWPFPDPNKNLEKYLTSNSATYLEEFEKWWTIVQGNKKVIAEFEYKRLLDSSEIKNKQMFDK